MPKTAKSRARSTKSKSRTSVWQRGFVTLLRPVKLSRSKSLVFAGTATLAGLIVVMTFAATAPVATVSSCAKAVGPFRDSGTNVLKGNGKRFIPYGVTTPGLAHADYQNYMADDANQILASATSWCSNTVRLQVSQDNLIGASGAVDPAFMAAIQTEVAQAKSLGLVVVLNAQTEDVGKEPGPTTRTVAFWKALTAVYGRDPQVMYDIFNEPRLNTGNSTKDWKIWQKGGKYAGATYLGMQQLANAIRSSGAKNLLWIEGPHSAGTLAMIKTYPVSADGPIMYAIHHPEGAHTATAWEKDFGYLVTQHVAPVVEGEWSNYASATKSECWADAPKAVPEFLQYLASNHIGMTVWTLRTGVMTETADMSDPTRINSNWACVDNINGPTGPNEGAGHQVQQWYFRQNTVTRKVAPTPTPKPTPTPTPTLAPTPSPTPVPTP